MPLASLKTDFINATKCILKENISKKPETILNQKNKIINTYNAVIEYINDNIGNRTDEEQKRYKIEFAAIQAKLKECLVKLESTYELQNNYDTIESEEIDIGIIVIKPEINMAADKINFLKFCSSSIPYIYKGDPLELPAFINSIELIEQITEQSQRELLATFIKSKISGRALEAIPVAAVSVREIIAALRDNIKTESSKIIEGRFAALRADKVSAHEFAKKAEELADSFKRSLIVEGIPDVKAKEMAIERTIEVCRASAKTDMVKSIIASSVYQTPNEVISKFVIESDKLCADKQILSFRQTYNGRFGNRRRFSNNMNKNNWNNDKYRNNNNRYQQKNSQYSNNNSNHNGHNQNKGNNGNNRQNNQRFRNTRNIRVLGNEDAPQRQMGDWHQETNPDSEETSSRRNAQFSV